MLKELSTTNEDPPGELLKLATQYSSYLDEKLGKY